MGIFLPIVTLPEPVIATTWPKFLTAGASFKVDRGFSQYGMTGWQLSVIFAGSQVASFNTTPQITADVSVWHINLAPTDTQPLNPAGGGESLPYTVVERLTATSTGEVYDVGTHKIMVSPNIATATAGAFQTPEEKILAQLQATLIARATGGAIESYSIAGRSVSKLSTPQLNELIGQYKWKVYQQRNPGRFGTPGEFAFSPENTSPFPPWKDS